MHILILGAYCSCNLGDAVICQSVAQQLRRRFPEADITIRDVIRRDRLAPRAEPGAAMLWRRRTFARVRRGLARLGVDLITVREERRVSENLAHLERICAGDYAAVVFAGGQMFMDGYALFLEACVQRFQERDIPVFFNACGTGPVCSKQIRRRLGDTLNQSCVQYVSCRDGVELVRAQYTQKAVFAADPALRAGELLNIPKEPSGTIGLGVIYPNTLSPRKTLKFWQGIIRALEARGKRWQLFTNGDPADVVFAKKLLASMGRSASGEDLLAARDVTPEGLVRTIARYDGLIAFRLHSHIIACSLGIPTAAVTWDEKLPRFFSQIGCPERCFTVDAAAEEVLAALECAKAQGYDTQRLQTRTREAEDRLIHAITQQLKL